MYLALLHYPVLNRMGQIVATAVTNVDVHDIARSTRTYGLTACYFVTPVAAQRELVSDIVGHWTSGAGAEYNPVRARAFQGCHVATSLDDVVAHITALEGVEPELVATSAQFGSEALTYHGYRQFIRAPDSKPQLMLFGTGWGIAPDVVNAAHHKLASVRVAKWVSSHDGSFNHLSVRSAVAIILDRIFGDAAMDG